MKADCLYNCTINTHFFAYSWGQKRSAPQQLWLWSILQKPTNLIFNLPSKTSFPLLETLKVSLSLFLIHTHARLVLYQKIVGFGFYCNLCDRFYDGEVITSLEINTSLTTCCLSTKCKICKEKHQKMTFPNISYRAKNA